MTTGITSGVLAFTDLNAGQVTLSYKPDLRRGSSAYMVFKLKEREWLGGLLGSLIVMHQHVPVLNRADLNVLESKCPIPSEEGKRQMWIDYVAGLYDKLTVRDISEYQGKHLNALLKKLAKVKGGYLENAKPIKWEKL